MSQRIASLHADFTANTTAFEGGLKNVKKGMTEAQQAALNAHKEFEKQAKREAAIQKQKEKFYKEEAAAAKKAALEVSRAEKEKQKAHQQSLQSLKNLAVGAIAAGAALVGAATKAYEAWQDYAGSVRDLATVSGTTATEASILLQVLDDFEISAEDVTAATRFMTKAGLTPTLDTLAKLSDQYLSINNAQERNEFILKNLGRSGLQWVNVLKQGGSALREMSGEVNKNLILSDEQIRKAEEARLAVDALADSWEGFKVSMGSAVGEIILYNKHGLEQLRTLQEVDKVTWNALKGQKFYSDEQKAVAAETEHAAAVADYYTRQLEAQKQVVEEDTEALTQLGRANQDLLSLTMNIQTETDTYNEKLGELNDEYETLVDEQSKYLEGGRKWKEIQGDIDANRTSVEALAAEHQKAAKKIIFSLLQQKMAADGLSDAEFNALVRIGQGFDILDAQTAESAILINEYANSYVEDMGKTQESTALSVNKATQLNEKYKSLKNLSQYPIEFFVSIVTQGSFPSPPNAGGGASSTTVSGSGQVINIHEKAGGGKIGGGDWTLVGDKPGGGLTPWSELIGPNGVVYDARATRAMLASGLVGNVKSRAAGSLWTDIGSGWTGGGGGGAPNPTWNKPKPHKGGGGGGGGNGGGFEQVSEPMAAAQSVTPQVQEIALQLQRSVGQISTRLDNKLNELIAVQIDANPRAIGSQVKYELSRMS